MLIVVIMGKWSDDSACLRVVHGVRLYSVLDTLVMMFVVVWCLALWLVCLCLVYVVQVADDICY